MASVNEELKTKDRQVSNRATKAVYALQEATAFYNTNFADYNSILRAENMLLGVIFTYFWSCYESRPQIHIYLFLLLTLNILFIRVNHGNFIFLCGSDPVPCL